MYLKDPHAHWEMIEGLESRYKVEECIFNTIFGSFQGYGIYASRRVAQKIALPLSPSTSALGVTSLPSFLEPCHAIS
jgi:hypothetical protein